MIFVIYHRNIKAWILTSDRSGRPTSRSNRCVCPSKWPSPNRFTVLSRSRLFSPQCHVLMNLVRKCSGRRKQPSFPKTTPQTQVGNRLPNSTSLAENPRDFRKARRRNSKWNQNATPWLILVIRSSLLSTSVRKTTKLSSLASPNWRRTSSGSIMPSPRKSNSRCMGTSTTTNWHSYGTPMESGASSPWTIGFYVHSPCIIFGRCSSGPYWQAERCPPR